MLSKLGCTLRWSGVAAAFGLWGMVFWALIVFAWLERVWSLSGNPINQFQAASIPFGRFAGWWVRDYPGVLFVAILLLIVVTAACAQNTVEGRRARRYAESTIHCPECDYDLRGSIVPSTCPECGADVKEGVQKTA